MLIVQHIVVLFLFSPKDLNPDLSRPQAVDSLQLHSITMLHLFTVLLRTLNPVRRMSWASSLFLTLRRPAGVGSRPAIRMGLGFENREQATLETVDGAVVSEVANENILQLCLSLRLSCSLSRPKVAAKVNYGVVAYCCAVVLLCYCFADVLMGHDRDQEDSMTIWRYLKLNTHERNVCVQPTPIVPHKKDIFIRIFISLHLVS